jgi:hypothetical protein
LGYSKTRTGSKGHLHHVGVIKGLSRLFFTRVGIKEMFTLQNLVYFTPIPIMQVEVYSTKIPNI